MSIDDDFFDLEHYIDEDESTRNKDCMKAILGRIQKYTNTLIQERDEYARQAAALKAAIVVKSSDVRITDYFGDGRYINLEINSKVKNNKKWETG